jgi:hypothetical protein
MKQNQNLQIWLKRSALGLALAATIAVGQAQTFTNIIFNQFDDATSWNTMAKWWGDPPVAYEWDGTVNVAPGPYGTNATSSGSMKVTVDWNSSHNQLMIWQEVDGNQTWWVNPENRINGFYYDLSFDIKFDPASSMGVNGGRGNIRFGVTTPSWAQRELIAFNPFPVTNDWTHVDCKISPNLVDIDQITGWYMYFNWQPGNITNQQVFWIDNLIFYTNLNKDLKPPTLSLAPVTSNPGLQIIAAAGDYPRQMIRTLPANEYTWIGKGSQPVTYSLTITNYPSNPYTNFQTHILLVPNPGTENAPDWNQPHTLALMIENHMDGTASGYLRYKTNLPNANAMMYNSEPTNGPVGHIATVEAPTPLGTWSLTFLNDTNITVTGPGGVTATANLELDAAGYFGSGLVAYFGNQPNGSVKSGQFCTLSRVKITGAWGPDIDDTFPGPDIDTNNWERIAAEASGVFVVGPNDVWWLTWTLPDLNFNTVQVSPDLAPGSWTDTTLRDRAFVKGATRTVRVAKSDMPSGSQCYFRMVKRVATQLQVLLPGESPAPGTPTGKTGTPTAQAVGVAFDVTVRAVDNEWNLIPTVADTVRITSSDEYAALPLDAPLVGGVGTFSVMLNQAGTWTITATDVSDGSKAPGTSSPVTAN